VTEGDVGKAQVLRLMWVHRSLAPTRQRHERGDRTRSATIITQRSDELWGTKCDEVLV